MKKEPLVILAGPTGVGKTALSIDLAKAISAEIISCDSMQIYRHMDIGTAKIKSEEMQGIPHHLIDALEPDETFNVSVFTSMAKDAIACIRENGHIPLAVGGTGFYIHALLYDTDFTKEEGASDVRKDLEELAEQIGPDALHEMLREIDQVSYEKIHPNNVKRVIRALEYHRLHHVPISDHNRIEKEKESPYEFCYFVLTDERQKLYDAIDRRVDRMVEDGLFDEVARLRDLGYAKDLVSMQGLGYKEIFSYFDGNYDKDEAIRIIKRDTRHFAKRQLTWFGGQEEVTWIDKSIVGDDRSDQLSFAMEELKKKGIVV